MARVSTLSTARTSTDPVPIGRRVLPTPRLPRLRPTLPGDEQPLRRLFERCSPSTRHDRFHAALGEIPPPYLRKVLAGDPDLHDALVVEVGRPDPDGAALVAIGSAARLSSELGSTVEIAVLVEDGWQRQGLGTAVLTDLMARARRRGIERVRWCMLSQGRDLVQTLRREVGPLEVRRTGDVITAEAWLGREPPTAEETPWLRP